MSRKNKRGKPLNKGWSRKLTTKLVMKVPTTQAKTSRKGAVLMVARVK